MSVLYSLTHCIRCIPVPCRLAIGEQQSERERERERVEIRRVAIKLG